MRRQISIMQFMRFTALLFISILAGCGTARVIIDEPPARNYSSDTIQTKKTYTTVGVPTKMLNHFDERLNKELAKSFTSGKGLLLEYRFLSFDEGDRTKRYLSGGFGDWGTASILIEAVFKDSKGNFLGKIRTDGRISSGIIGGSVKSALDQAAKELGEYAKLTFR